MNDFKIAESLVQHVRPIILHFWTCRGNLSSQSMDPWRIDPEIEWCELFSLVQDSNIALDIYFFVFYPASGSAGNLVTGSEVEELVLEHAVERAIIFGGVVECELRNL